MHPRQKVINTDNQTSAFHADKFVRCIGTYESPTAYLYRPLEHGQTPDAWVLTPTAALSYSKDAQLQ